MLVGERTPPIVPSEIHKLEYPVVKLPVANMNITTTT